MRLPDFIDQTNVAATPEEVFQLFQSALGAYGFDRICFAALTPSAQTAYPARALGPALAVKCPEDWMRHYVTQRYFEQDPIVHIAPTRRRPFAWSDVLTGDKVSPKQRQILLESQEAGLHNGLSIPLYGPGGEAFVLSLATDNVKCDTAPFHGELHLLAMQFHIAYASLTAGANGTAPAPRLSNRERECLTWTAQGKSAWAVSMILGVSENTVNFHLKSAMKKLGTTNRVKAVVLAVRAGLIHP